MAESPAPVLARLRDRSATEAAIVAAGERILLRDGFPGLNVQTLAAEAGCDRKLVYRYFDGADGVVTRIADRAHAALAASLASIPQVEAASLRTFARISLLTWLAALRASPLSLRLMAWALVEDSGLLRRIEADRAAVLQTWMRERRPRLRVPPEGDPTALNAVLLAAVQHLALSADRRGGVAGLTLDPEGWPRAEAALDRLLLAFPD
ncbi:TetR/AcrR family transcriptional regulator [Brevundimonas sp.]|uniref:TetR/AcrR family transcriptional regulator n=1 Tax=Brevundimonas sp. TaxID=1871086 RepID=UPI002CC380DE|nr:TetR/AcrR family transcriptional regulator [Brevundimonas sp.]HWQ86646.1 TetR/AcrR family transcriptional regulator [Brevundimonas sp.]